MRSEPGEGEPRPLGELRHLIDEHRDEILARWADACRADPKAARLPDHELLDHLPVVLDAIGAAVASGGKSLEQAPDVHAAAHALARLAEGYDLEDVVGEYASLRRVLFGILRRHRPGLVAPGFEALDRAIDESVAQSVSRYAQARHRTLQALDRISEVSLGVEDVEDLLPRLLRVLMETVPAVDSAAILLVEGEWLRVRTAIGLIQGRDLEYRVRVGEGFAGTVAATGKPVALRSAATDPMVQSAFLRQSGLRALYGVPLLRGSEVVGVAHMGSLTAYEFAAEDLLLFRTAADRAAMLIVQAKQRASLREAVELRDRVIAIAGHDIRNPLQVIIQSIAMLLKRQETGEEARRDLQRIDRSARRIAGIVSGLVDYMQARFKNVLPIEPKEADLLQVVRAVVDEVRVTCPGRTIEVESSGDVRGSWDPLRLGRLVGNLVTNALQYGDPEAPVEVRLAEKDADSVLLAVTNRGPPIPAELIPHLFEPFRRGPHAKSEGFGLGLYIAEAVAAAHGGEIRVRSDDAGTVFEVRLPRRAARGATGG